MDGDGSLLGNQALAICAEEGGQTAPAVAYNTETGHFLVAWEDARGDGYDVYARAVEGGSGDMEDAFIVDEDGNDQRYPDVAANEANGEYLVTWQHDNGSDEDVYGRRATTTAGVDDPFAITTAADDQQHPAVAYNAAGNEYLVAWTHSNGSDDDVHARRVGAGGGLLGSELTLASGSAEQRYPDLA